MYTCCQIHSTVFLRLINTNGDVSFKLCLCNLEVHFTIYEKNLLISNHDLLHQTCDIDLNIGGVA